MKHISLFLAGLLAALSVPAQTSLSAPVPRNMNAVTITVNGNKNLQITVDGKDYILNAGNTNIASENKSTIRISDLETGQHTFQVTRMGQNVNRSEKISTIFNLRRRYDMLINVNANGSLELLEKIKSQNNGNNYNTAMNNADFTKLLNSVKYQRTTSGKRSVVTTAFNTTNNYFSSSQTVQLIQQVNSETYRLELAKLSYRTVTDRDNFNQVSNLLYNQASRNELDAFVNNYYEADNSIIAMSDASFNSLYQSIQQQRPASSQVSSLTNAFNSSNNYFTAYQASQLIQLVAGESTRLQLAKSSYRSIVDRDNLYQVYELLNSQASRNELENYVNNYQEVGNTGGNNGIAMTDASFNNLYQTIQQQWPVSTQINSLTTAFNNNNNYFTTYQASRLIQLVNGESNRLQLAKLSYRSITDPANFNQIYNLLGTQASKNDLAAYVANYNGGGTGSNVAMTDANFNNLYQTILQQWPVSTQMNSLTNAFNNSNNYFTTYQASRLIQIAGGENNRLQLAKLSYRSITDPANFSQISDLLGSQASKNELAAYVNNYTGGGTGGYRVAMADADFNMLYQNIQMQFLPGAKMTALTNTFNNSTYYFTSAQARQLIELVSAESNRLQLAKLSYRTITDRDNFTRLNDLFYSQASRDELAAYVNSYAVN